MPQSLDQPQPWAPTQQAAHVASSNRTLNTFLGGRHHSWMTDAHPTLNLSRPQDNATRKRSRPLNDSTTDGNELRRESLPTNQSPGQSATIDYSRHQTVLPSPALTDEPSPIVSSQMDSPNRGGNGFSDTVGIQQPVAVGHFQGGGIPPTSTSSDPRTPTVVSPQTTNNIVTPAASNVRSQLTTSAPMSISIQPVPPPPSALPPGSTMSSPQINQRNVSAESRQFGMDPKRRRLQHQDEPGEGTNRHLHVVASRILQCTNENSANPAEIARYRVLQDACEIRDMHYIALHQAFCCWSLDKPGVHSALAPYLSSEIIDHGFAHVESFLRQNVLISHAHLVWFASFPTPGLEICRPQQNPLAGWISRFLLNLSNFWDQMLSTVHTRRYPLLAYEIIANLCCNSRTLQPIIFTMSYRVLGANDISWGSVLNNTFFKDQQSEAQMSGTQHTAEARHAVRTGFANYYQRVMNEIRKQQFSQNSVPSPTMHDLVSTPQQGARRSLGHPAPIPPRQLIHPSQQAQVPRRRVTGPAMLSSTNTQMNFDAQNPSLPNRMHMVQSPTVDHVPQPSSTLSLERSQPVVQGLPDTVPPQQRTAPLLPVPQPQRLTSNSNTPALDGQGRPRPLHRQSSQPILPSARGTVPAPQSPGLQYPPHMSYSGPPASSQLQVNPSQPQQHWPRHLQLVANGQVAQAGPVPPQHQLQTDAPIGIATTSPAAPSRPVMRHQGLITPVGEIPIHERPMSPHGQGSLQIGLHMVGSRSPRRAPAEAVQTRYYQYTKQLVIKPVECLPQMTLQTLSFHVPETCMAKLSRKNVSTGLPFCYYFEGAHRYRLRMCAKPEQEKDLKISDWVVSACSWPQHIFISLNGSAMGLRRKQHFQKDLPLELTDGLIAGLNTVTISFPAVPQNYKRGQKFFVAIELVETNSHDFLRSTIENTQCVNAAESKSKIHKRLRPSDSDDLIIQDDLLRVSLADPFSSNMFEIPARGKNCQHLECFDLEIWLQTRPRKPTQKGGGGFVKGTEPSTVDDWRCPICDGDARPPSLRIDEYFVQVRNELLARGENEVKTITVTSDGRWAAVEEPDDTEEDTPAPSRANTTSGDIGTSKTTSTANVIEILDD